MKKSELRLLVDVLEVFGDVITEWDGEPISSLVLKIKTKKLKTISLSLGNTHADTPAAPPGASRNTSARLPAGVPSSPGPTLHRPRTAVPVASSSLLARVLQRKASTASHTTVGNNAPDSPRNTPDVPLSNTAGPDISSARTAGNTSKTLL